MYRPSLWWNACAGGELCSENQVGEPCLPSVIGTDEDKDLGLFDRVRRRRDWVGARLGGAAGHVDLEAVGDGTQDAVEGENEVVGVLRCAFVGGNAYDEH